MYILNGFKVVECAGPRDYDFCVISALGKRLMCTETVKIRKIKHMKKCSNRVEETCFFYDSVSKIEEKPPKDLTR